MRTHRWVFLEVLREKIWVIVLYAVLVSVSALVFSFVEKRSFFDSIYWAIAAVSTVGSRDVVPHTTVGRLLFIFDAVSGISIYVYLIISWQASTFEERVRRKILKKTRFVTLRNQQATATADVPEHVELKISRRLYYVEQLREGIRVLEDLIRRVMRDMPELRP